LGLVAAAVTAPEEIVARRFRIGVLATMFYAVSVTFVLLKVLDFVMGLRVSKEEEVIGLDITQHEESAYTLLD